MILILVTKENSSVIYQNREVGKGNLFEGDIKRIRDCDKVITSKQKCSKKCDIGRDWNNLCHFLRDKTFLLVLKHVLWHKRSTLGPDSFPFWVFLWALLSFLIIREISFLSPSVSSWSPGISPLSLVIQQVTSRLLAEASLTLHQPFWEEPKENPRQLLYVVPIWASVCQPCSYFQEQHSPLSPGVTSASHLFS